MNELITQLSAPIFIFIASIIVGSTVNYLGKRKFIKHNFQQLNEIVSEEQGKDIENAHKRIAKRLGIHIEKTIYKITRIVFLLTTFYIIGYSIYFVFSGG